MGLGGQKKPKTCQSSLWTPPKGFKDYLENPLWGGESYAGIHAISYKDHLYEENTLYICKKLGSFNVANKVKGTFKKFNLELRL